MRPDGHYGALADLILQTSPTLRGSELAPSPKSMSDPSTNPVATERACPPKSARWVQTSVTWSYSHISLRRAVE